MAARIQKLMVLTALLLGGFFYAQNTKAFTLYSGGSHTSKSYIYTGYTNSISPASFSPASSTIYGFKLHLTADVPYWSLEAAYADQYPELQFWYDGGNAQCVRGDKKIGDISMDTEVNFNLNTPVSLSSITSYLQFDSGFGWGCSGNYSNGGAWQDGSNNTEVLFYDGQGASINNPAVPNISMPQCGDTSWTVSGVDFGKGICNAVRFLVVPPSGITDAFSTLSQNNNNKIPFSYYYELSSTIASTTASTTTSTLPTIAITTSGTSSISNLNIPLFSPSTINNATTYSGFGLLRTLASAVLYVGFGFGLYEVGVTLFRRKDHV